LNSKATTQTELRNLISHYIWKVIQTEINKIGSCAK